MMTPDQIERVQDSFALVLPVTHAAAADFYNRLFAMVPEARAMFRGDMDDQGRKLFLTLATVVDALDSLDDVLPVARALAIRHVDHGVREHHYAAVGQALLDTLRHALGDRFDAATEAAWAQAYDLLSATMIAAARRVASMPADAPASPSSIRVGTGSSGSPRYHAA